MRKYLSFLIASMVLLEGAVSSSAQNTMPRTKGYRGSVSLTNQYFVIVGLETSHGYMFNEHHYLGAGIGGFFIPTDNIPYFGQAFIDYRAYLSDKPSTMVVGIKTGFCHAFKTRSGDHNGYTFMNSATAEPNIGWIWGGKKGKGFGLNISSQILIQKNDVQAMPKLNIFYEF